MEILQKIALGLGIVIIISLVACIPLWLLWNWLCPVLFHLPKITVLQALGLNFLSTVLFGKYSSHKKGGKDHEI